MKRVFLLGLVCLLAASCSKDIQNSAAVKQAVLDHLKSRSDFGLNLDAMDIQVSSVSFREKEADAQVAFVPKGAPSGGGMSMTYKLEREGDKWVVKSKAMSGINGGPTGAMPELPPGHAPVAAPDTPPKGTK